MMASHLYPKAAHKMPNKTRMVALRDNQQSTARVVETFVTIFA